MYPDIKSKLRAEVKKNMGNFTLANIKELFSYDNIVNGQWDYLI